MDDIDTIHSYWRTQRDIKYKEPIKRSEYLYNFIKDIVPKNSHIVELGCNLGRNLNYLYGEGYTNLTGVEISANSIEQMKQIYNVKWAVINSPIEDCIKELKADCYITMAVLEHIHPESEWMFKEMSKAKYIVTIEDELHDGARHRARKYDKIFNNQIKGEQFKDTNIFDPSFVARLFKCG